MKLLLVFYQTDQRIFRGINRHYQNKFLNAFFRTITHAGGARFTISSILLLVLFLNGPIRQAAFASAAALALSHLPVHFIKKWYPRKRPYIILENAFFPSNPLQDHSFPSGHTTAIFSLVLPFILFMPVLSAALVPLACMVALSRVYLGLHYPTDILVGALLGTTAGILSYSFLL
ncbi:phosphatase PAP2 family protein [Mesobacillus sp. AQ2]|jgi:undecaprenyl-diphosphatase|uniref:phosphatase PAP2 family protein n=1 Tax=Bacillaceae TaxID=186817 RepID=UPI0011A4F56B|nr:MULTISPECIES: phosphatase PAP2 family protein [Bacillaceae]MCM3124301.1 phosphatase PAP2 family protein [Mesobacillus sp. MER 33]MCM3234989.1 phosphatase PAP2 family protein [Mesobacillus sp. MER 48]WHX41278.1 phosphatase PAP2 family protein [Mesobacillus sp. AQ2]